MVLQKERKVFSDRILSPQAVGTGAVRGTKASLLFIPILTLFSFPAPQTTDQFDLISPFSVDRPTLVFNVFDAHMLSEELHVHICKTS